MSSVNWLSPQGSYRRTEISTRHFCKTPVRVTKNVEWAISWKPSMLMKWTKGKISRTLPQKAAGYRREQTTAWLRCVPGKAYVNRSYKLNSIYDIASRSSVSQNTRNECIIQKLKKKSFPIALFHLRFYKLDFLTTTHLIELHALIFNSPNKCWEASNAAWHTVGT